MALFKVEVPLEELTIAPTLVYSGVQNLNKFVYVLRILCLNQDAIRTMHHLESFDVGMFSKAMLLNPRLRP